ncbi:MAG: hypothetical protein JF615_12075 [Asticcacaulis sp.]|nr:hypothetical protein [Asticcacaulis sp.]
MKVPDDLHRDVSQRDDGIEVQKYPFAVTVVVLGASCGLFWAAIWALVRWLTGG